MSLCNTIDAETDGLYLCRVPRQPDAIIWLPISTTRLSARRSPCKECNLIRENAKIMRTTSRYRVHHGVI
ncbi:hypothetical protein EYZ11_002553 [Aspergillus tanneri]|uniref:Uncharacterized protein n=1 Tax=Aspergillus tanneri TaxID=1220188 RepID=A0A4S3JQI0_9EURO|nr:hypothetical protein EYZ11_002553 [Aspergillus tanneri]